MKVGLFTEGGYGLKENARGGARAEPSIRNRVGSGANRRRT
jgi:hypothetical protein